MPKDTEKKRNLSKWASQLTSKDAIKRTLAEMKVQYPNINSLPKTISEVKTEWYANHAPEPKVFIKSFRAWANKYKRNPDARKVIELTEEYIKDKKWKLLDRLWITAGKVNAPSTLKQFNGNQDLKAKFGSLPDPFLVIRTFKQDEQDQRRRKQQGNQAAEKKQEEMLQLDGIFFKS